MIATAGLCFVLAILFVAFNLTVLAGIFAVGFALIIFWAIIPFLVYVGLPLAVLFLIYKHFTR